MVALTIMIAAAIGGMHLYPELSFEERSNFLYYWPPNQLVIFSLGFLLYHGVKSDSVRGWLTASRITANGASVALVVALLALSFYGPRKFFDWSLLLPPTHLVISLLFLSWAIVLVIKPRGFAINQAIVGLGKVSFSAYILHFSVLKYVSILLDRIWPFATVGAASIPHVLTLLAASIVITRYVSAVSYRYVEQPFVNFGKSIIYRAFPSSKDKAEPLVTVTLS